MAPVSRATQRDSANEKSYYKMTVVLGTCYCKRQHIFVVQIYRMREGGEKRGREEIDSNLSPRSGETLGTFPGNALSSLMANF